MGGAYAARAGTFTHGDPADGMTMSTHHDPARVSRRVALGAAAAAGAALGGAGNALAAPSSSDASGPTTDPYFVPEGTEIPEVNPAPTTPGTRYLSLAGIAFKPISNTTTYSSPDAFELSSGSISTYTAPVQLPHGARITEMVIYVTHPDSDPFVVRLVCHRSSVASTGAVFNVASIDTNAVTPAAAARLQSVAVSPATIGAVVDEGAAAYFVVAFMPSDAAHRLWGVRVGYVTADAGRFFPINPVRAYDSRATLPDPGLLGPNASRLILVKDSRANGSGAVITPDVVPVGATAIACNLTVTGTTGPNFLALTPGDAGSFTASAINWSDADQSIANGLIAKLDANRFVRVWCGDQTGSTHVLLDVNGYWL
jgi:hypothetical protein